MIVLIVTACPAGLRGDLSKWLAEVAPGVFIGDPGARIRDILWDRTIELSKDGRALLVYTTNNEQGMNFRSFRHDWEPVDFEGLTLIMKPNEDSRESKPPPKGDTSHGWARARFQRRRYHSG